STGARSRRPNLGSKRSTPRSGCAQSPTGRSDSSFRRAWIRTRSRAGSRPWASTASRASPPGSLERRSTSRRWHEPPPTRWGSRSLSVTIRTGIAADFERWLADPDEPFADPSCVPTWYLARETTKHVKVVLGGDGGDELFGGYKRYAKHLRTRWRRALVAPG